MAFMDLLKSPPPDTELLKTTGNMPALIRLMGHADPDHRHLAAEALGSLGASAVTPLLLALSSKDAHIRMGAIEALSIIRDPHTTDPLRELLLREKTIEARWAAVIALGEIGSPEAIPDLILLLRDTDKYIRYGAARSLETLGWQPSNESDRICYHCAREEWDAVTASGAAAVPLLSALSRDTDPSTRIRVITRLGGMGQPDARNACRQGLRDRDPAVRWSAVLASMNCGIKSIHLPLLVADRERSGPDPAAAALLNFLFLGIGYNYIGKWWGFPVFMTWMCVLVLAQLYAGPFLPYLVAYPITAVLGIHTYYCAERMNEL
jgi:HEAT repeat protein